MKRIKMGDKYYRYRRGELVEIPIEWVGKTPNKNQMNNRKSRRYMSRRTRKNKNKST